MNILSQLKGREALLILQELVRERPELEKRIQELAHNQLEGVEVEDVAEEVFYDLESLQIEELWEDEDLNGHECIEPHDIMEEMLSNTILHHVEEMNRYLSLDMGKEARDYCLGIIIGLNQYEKESIALINNWSLETPRYFITEILEEWKKREKDPYLLQSFKERLQREFPDWFRY